ncbi:DUF6090 family protein [Croceitalea rosinachiae]|uniref:DUF6090 family protein n=1 Tax=Croceitalea rosinachiae TaxID=3075596 RepID=A0ABU3A754_9FLAO|nr:DUF6090 family protein [Croceitalea sp. F388]MDT0605989.1 DUF6090 family protein [Croceitalea sp. F388]
MIKFFSKIRKNLLAKKTFREYLLYAFGEIVLVVVGILIALQINNWNEQKKQEEKERAFLKEINLDFKSNKEQLDSIIDFNKINFHAGSRLSEILKAFDFENPKRTETNYKIADSIQYYNDLIWRNKSFNPKNGTVEALLNSSSFDLIINDTLRRNLISWKDVLNDYLEEEKLAMNFIFYEYGPWARASFDPNKDDDPENTKALFSKRHRNFIYQRTGDLQNVLSAVKAEGIVNMINDIIRLTESKTDD